MDGGREQDPAESKHLGLITFWFQFRKTWQLRMFMIYGFWDVSMTPNTNFVVKLWTHEITPRNSRKTIHVSDDLFWEISRVWNSWILKNVEKRVGADIPKVRVICFEKFDSWDNYPAENMELEFGSYGIGICQQTWRGICESLQLRNWNFWTLQLCYLGTMKL